MNMGPDARTMDSALMIFSRMPRLRLVARLTASPMA